MSLKAGRVGVAPDQVDLFGNIIGGGSGGDAYTKAESDAKFETLTGAAADLAQIYNNIGIYGAKNLLKNNAISTELNGIVYTVNDDLSITADGTASDTSYIYLHQNVVYTITDDVIASGCPSGGGNDTYKIIFYDTTSGIYYEDKGNGVTIPSSVSGHIFTSYIRIASGVEVNDLIFEPMIRLASDPDTTYRPYAQTNRELTTGKADIIKAEFEGVKNTTTLAEMLTGIKAALAAKGVDITDPDQDVILVMQTYNDNGTLRTSSYYKRQSASAFSYGFNTYEPDLDPAEYSIQQFTFNFAVQNTSNSLITTIVPSTGAVSVINNNTSSNIASTNAKPVIKAIVIK